MHLARVASCPGHDAVAEVAVLCATDFQSPGCALLGLEFGLTGLTASGNALWGKYLLVWSWKRLEESQLLS